jgi:ferric-dicitrate binding protein FerR (iron transport regulator)
MNEHNDYSHRADTETDADLAALLRAVGPRATPAPEVTAEVRAAVAAEWRAAVASQKPQAVPQPRRRVQRPWLALAASVAAVAIAVSIALPRLQSAGDPVATVARVDGAVELRHEAGEWRALTTGTTIIAGDDIRTAPGARLALRRDDGLEVRLDHGTQLAFLAKDRATLAQGSVYVDAGATAQGDSFALDTAFGDVRHLGTQYIASLGPGALQVAVREGSVAVERGKAPVVARAGESLSVRADGSVERTRVDVHGDTWRWAAVVAPEFVIEGRSLDEFLVWVGRETGRQVVYTSADAAREAEQTTLRGSVSGLAPEAAVAAVFAAEPGLRHEIAAGQIRVDRAGD